MPGQSGGPRGEQTAEQKARAAQLRAELMLENIRHWLKAVAEFTDLRKAPGRVSAKTGCKRGGGDHDRHVRVVPRPPRQTTHLACTAQRRNIPAEVLMTTVILPLKRDGYAVSRPTTNYCGCITFNVMPNKWAGA